MSPTKESERCWFSNARNNDKAVAFSDGQQKVLVASTGSDIQSVCGTFDFVQKL